MRCHAQAALGKLAEPNVAVWPRPKRFSQIYSPLEPFFTKTWRPGDIEPVTRDAALGASPAASKLR